MRTHTSGFSLVEISIVLAILSVVLAGILPFVTEATKSQASKATIERFEKVEEALIAHYMINGSLPCPASPSSALNTAAYGTANCSGAAVVTGGTARIGAVPIKALGIEDEAAFDGWGRRFIYAVDVASTVPATFGASGTLIVRDGSGNDMSSAVAYVLVSTGPNGHGGYTRNGTVLNSASTNADELNNCARGAAPCNVAADAVFIKKSPTIGSGPADTFDDVVRYKPRVLVENALGASGSDLHWNAYGTHIANTNTGNVGIGTTSPGFPLHVASSGSTSGALLALLQPNLPNGGFNQIYLGQSAGTNASSTITHTYNSGTPSNSYLSLGLYGSSYSLNVAGTGNVGIGTTSPLRLLHVSGNTGSTELAIEDRSVASGTVGRVWRLRNSASGTFMVEAMNGPMSGGQNAMNILPNGNVGIGTTSPAAKLDVNGSISATSVGTFGGGTIVMRDSDHYAWSTCPSGMAFVGGLAPGGLMTVATAAENFWHAPTYVWWCSK